MDRELPFQPGLGRVAPKQLLDALALEIPLPAREQRRASRQAHGQILPDELGRVGEQGPLATQPALDPLDADAPALQIRVSHLEQGRFRDAQAVVINRGKQSAVPGFCNPGKEAFHLLLGEVFDRSPFL